jgi:hypothetical protein
MHCEGKMNDYGKVSIVVPVYNTKDKLSLKRNVIRLLLRLKAYRLLYCAAWLNLKMVGLLWRR